MASADIQNISSAEASVSERERTVQYYNYLKNSRLQKIPVFKGNLFGTEDKVAVLIEMNPHTPGAEFMEWEHVHNWIRWWVGQEWKMPNMH